MKTFTFVLRVSLKFGRVPIWNRHRETLESETTHFLDCCWYGLRHPSFGYHRVANSSSDPEPATMAAITTRKGTIINTGERAT